MDCPPPLGSEDEEEEEEGDEDFGDFQTVLETNKAVTNDSIKNRIHLDTSDSPTRNNSLFEIPPPKHDSSFLDRSSSPHELPPSLPTSPEPSENQFFEFQDTAEQKFPAENFAVPSKKVLSEGELFHPLAASTQNTRSMFGAIVEKDVLPENTEMFADFAALQSTEPSDFFSNFEDSDENSHESNSFAADFAKSCDFNDALDTKSIGENDEFGLKASSHIEEAVETVPTTFESETTEPFDNETIEAFVDFPSVMEKCSDSAEIGPKIPVSEEFAFAPDLSFDIDTPSPLKEDLGAKSVFSWDSFEENTVTAVIETDSRQVKDDSLFADISKNSEHQEEASQFALFSDDDDQPTKSSDDPFLQLQDSSKLSQPLSSNDNEATRFECSSIISDKKMAEVGDVIPLENTKEDIDDDKVFYADSPENSFTEFEGPKLKHSDDFDSGSEDDSFIQNKECSESAETDDFDSKEETISPESESKGENNDFDDSGQNVFAEFEQNSEKEDDFDDFDDFATSSIGQAHHNDNANTGVENDDIDQYAFSNIITDTFTSFNNSPQNSIGQDSADSTEFSDEHQNKALESADFSSKAHKEDVDEFETTAKAELEDLEITADDFDDFAEFDTTAKVEFADFETTVDADNLDDFADFETTTNPESANTNANVADTDDFADFETTADADDFDDFADFETTTNAESANTDANVADTDDFADFEATDTSPAIQPAATLETFSGSQTRVQPLEKTISECFGGNLDDKDVVTPESHTNGRLLMCKVNDADAQFAVATKWLTTPSFTTLVNTLCLSSGTTQPSSKPLQAPAVLQDEFDVFGSMDQTVNTSTILSRDTDELSRDTDELSRDPPHTAPSQKHADILSAYKTEQAKELSKEAAAIVDSLPDLQFMLSSVLMFPLKTS